MTTTTDGIGSLPWVKFDDSYPDHRKVRRLSDGAFRLHTEAIMWAARHLTDGVILGSELADVSHVSRPHRHVIALVSRGLWEEIDDGWVIHDYLDFQPSADRVREDRKARTARQQRWRDARRRTTNASTDDSPQGTVDASRDALVDAAPRARVSRTRPDPKGRVGEGTGTHSPGECAREVHDFEPSPDGSCAHCRLPRSNRRHTKRSRGDA